MTSTARYLLIQIFSDACPHCTAQAPVVKRLFQEISANPELNDGTLKMVGVGYYGTPATMERWRDKYGAPFPLIPDPKGQFSGPWIFPAPPLTWFWIAGARWSIYLSGR